MWQVEIKNVAAIHPIIGADAIECAIVGDGWPCVVRKGDFSVGDKIVYYPEDAVMPPAILERMGLVGKLSGTKKDRVKAVKLRGQLSIGLIEKYDVGLHGDCPEGVDLSERLGVVRWEEPIPEILRGVAGQHPFHFIKYDIDSINNHNPFNEFDYVFVSEKLHGVASSFGYNPIRGFTVSSRNITLEKDESNLYWKMALKYNIEPLLVQHFTDCKLNEDATLFLHGEIAGKGVQDFNYGLAEPELFVYDMRINSRHWIPTPIMHKIVDGWGLKRVPDLWRGLYGNASEILALVGGASIIDNKTIREGVVVRNYERSKIAKIVSEAYILRKGGTEFH